MLSVEVLMSSHYDDKADVFSYAISLFEVLICRKPHSENLDKTRSHYVFMNAVRDGMRPGPLLSEPYDIMHVILRCWEADPAQRPSIKQVFEDLEYISENRSFSLLILT